MAPGPASAVPPPLPPSVEEAYRRKCIQLKERTKEVEEANDASRLRLSRLKRQVEKMRIERAFLLEQLARRTSTNVEDSIGSPSPPPTPQQNPKPLRLKRGHRKTSLAGGDGDDKASTRAPGASGLSFVSHSRRTLSPGSEVRPGSRGKDGLSPGRNGVSADGQAPTAYELFVFDRKPALMEQHKDDSDGGEEWAGSELATQWEDMDQKEREEYQERSVKAQDGHKSGARAKGSRGNQAKDEDVEMQTYDSDQETQGEKGDD